jgi:DNA polymerase-3 subunit alpha
VGRALGVPLADVIKVTAAIPEDLGIEISEALEKSDDLRKLYETDGTVREMIDLAMKIEGLARNIGTHAAAVVIADEPLTEYVPLARVSGKNDVITQWSMNDVEAAGLLKMDFLGLRNLTILQKAVDIIAQTTGQTVDPYKFPLDDKATFALLQRGETKGIFQLESGGIRDLLQKMKPDHFRDVIATNALYRPGPLEGGMVRDYVEVKHGRQQPEYIHPICKEILEETHGVMVYQEQVMRILNRLGGIELASAYTCIKAISKKKEAMIQQFYEQFIAGSKANGLSEGEAKDFWNLIIKFAGYGFNKSHSTAYALVAYMTAYLKAHYPVEFMAALLSGDISKRNFKTKDQLVEHLEDCQRMNIEVVPASVQTSEADFAVAEGKIFFALSAVKGCGGAAADAIVAARKKEGPFKDIFDFSERVDPQQCGRAAIETLIKAGAFDWTGAKRAQLYSVVEKAIQSGAAAQADRKAGQKSLFGVFEDDAASKPAVKLPAMPEWEERELLANEREVLGYYQTSHPLKQHEKVLAGYCSHRTSNLSGLPDRAEVIMGGMIGALKYSHTKNPKPGAPSKYVMFDLEDTDGVIRCILWPNDYVNFGELVQAEAVMVARGQLDRRGGDEANLIVNELIPLDELGSRYTTGCIIRLEEGTHGLDTLPALREIVRGYPGARELRFAIQLADGSRVLLKTNKVQVDITTELQARVDDLLGPGYFQRITSAPQANTRPKPQNGRFSRS